MRHSFTNITLTYVVLLDPDWLISENIYVFINAVSGFCDILLPQFGSRLEKYKNVNYKEGAQWMFNYRSLFFTECYYDYIQDGEQRTVR